MSKRGSRKYHGSHGPSKPFEATTWTGCKVCRRLIRPGELMCMFRGRPAHVTCCETETSVTA